MLEAPHPSDLHYFHFLLAAHLFDALDLVVRELLNLFQGALLFVCGDGLVLGSFLDGIVAVATQIAQHRAMLLQNLVQVLHHLTPSLLRHRRYGHPHDLAIVLWVESKVRSPQRLLDLVMTLGSNGWIIIMFGSGA